MNPSNKSIVPATVENGQAGRSIARRIWDLFRREPMLLVSSGYVFISLIGLLDLYWFYRSFRIPVLEYLQSGDYFVAGLRRPIYLAMLGWTLAVSMLALWPEYWRRRNPERAAALDGRWWFRALLPRRDDWWAYFGLHPETMALVGATVMVFVVLSIEGGKRAEALREGGGHAIAIELDSGALPGDWRLLGSSSAFLFAWDRAAQRAEVLPIDAIARIRPLPAVAAAEATP